MENRKRRNGKFVKQKVVDQRKKRLEGRKKFVEKLHRQNETEEENQQEKIIVPLRNHLVNLISSGEKLKCSTCKFSLRSERIIGETREELYSMLKIDCEQCRTINSIPTGERIQVNDRNYSDFNLAATLGAVYAGIGCTALNKILACLDIPPMTMKKFKRYEREVGLAIEKSAQDSCATAALEERQLVIENLKDLCTLL